MSAAEPIAARSPFPDPRHAPAEGPLAVGGDLSPALLLHAYARGIFPWFDDDAGPVLWWSPDPRTVLFPERMKVSRSLRRRLRRGDFAVTFDTAFEQVIAACAAPRPGQDGSWITPAMQAAYVRLHALGFAHSVETWHEGCLAGGLYGVSLGRMFFGESMFAAQTDASKVALAYLVNELRRWRFELIDCQIDNAHLASLGAEALPRERFLERVAANGRHATRRGRWRRCMASSGNG